MAILLKSILHNLGVVLVGFALAYFGTMVDSIGSARRCGFCEF